MEGEEEPEEGDGEEVGEATGGGEGVEGAEEGDLGGDGVVGKAGDDQPFGAVAAGGFDGGG